MKIKFAWVFIFALGLIRTATADAPQGFRFQNTDLVISAGVPPASILVTDAFGRRAGVDPSIPLNADGTQGNKVDSGLTEIPLSHVWQENDSTFDGTDYTNNPSTLWNINVYDAPAQAYDIILEGIQDGLDTVSVAGIFREKGRNALKAEFDVFVSAGQAQTISLGFDPGANELSYRRIPGNEDLLSDVQTACQLGLITSRKACEFLTLRAKLVERALDKHRDNEAKAALEVFLHALGDSRPSGCRDEDRHLDVKEPALTILKEDAKALLAGLGDKNHGHHDRGEDGHHGDGRRN